MTEASVSAVGCCQRAGCTLTDHCIASTDATLASYDMDRVKLWCVQLIHRSVERQLTVNTAPLDI